MHRRTILATAAAIPGRAATSPEDLAGSGWIHGQYQGVRPARFVAEPEGALRIEAEATGSFVRRRLSGVVQCLSWRWQVELRSGDDRAIALAIGFAGYPPRAGAWQRAQHAIAQGAAGNHTLPRAVLVYLWGGPGVEPPRFYASWLAGLVHLRSMRHTRGQAGQWLEERVDLDADWRAAFGGDPPLLQEIAIGTDLSDTRARLDARVERIQLFPC